MASEPHIIMFHGTTDAFLPSILLEGLVARPARRPSHLTEDGSVNHLMSSLDGVYLSSTLETSEWHARSAASKFGGEPLMFVLRVPVGLLVPDEDELAPMINWAIYRALGYDDGEDYSGLSPCDRAVWSVEVAVKAAASLMGDYADEETVATMARHLYDMIAPVCGEEWDRDPDFFHPEAQVGWNCPNWMVALDATPSGRTLYRDKMDAVCRMLAGMHPHDYPCGMDACRGRVVDSIDLQAEVEGVVVVGYGSPTDPTSDFSRLDALEGSELGHTSSLEALVSSSLGV